MSDGLKAIGGLNIRYADLIVKTVKEERTPEEIIGSISAKLDQLGNEE